MIRKIVLGLCLFFAPLLKGQNASASPYSFAGLGELNFRGTQVNRFMGGLDVYSDSIHANLTNPASYGAVSYTHLTLPTKRIV